MIIVGICGGSASGKTKISKKLHDLLCSYNVSLLKYDSYYLPFSEYSFEERTKLNFDHPNSFDHDLIKKHLVTLKSGKSVDVPVYNYITYTRDEEVTTITPPDILIVEGLFTLYNDDIIDLCDLKVYVDADDDIRLLRRLKRDVEKRGRTIESVSKQYIETVKPMHDKYIIPTKKNADIIIPRGVSNEVAISLVEVYLKDYILNKKY